jgi:hypothetical protein
MNCKNPAGLVSAAILVLSFTSTYAENIDPYEDDSQYAYGENVGWINFEPNVAGPNVGATVSSNKLTGFIWAENIGWINLSPSTYGGVINDGTGWLSGYAWGENVGWINFSPSYGGVTIDLDGDFSGWAWGENIGWIHFQDTLKVDWDDLANFAAQWMQTGIGLEADLYEDEKVDFIDYSILAGYWLDYCPDDWQLAPAGYKVKTSWAAP